MYIMLSFHSYMDIGKNVLIKVHCLFRMSCINFFETTEDFGLTLLKTTR